MLLFDFPLAFNFDLNDSHCLQKKIVKMLFLESKVFDSKLYSTHQFGGRFHCLHSISLNAKIYFDKNIFGNQINKQTKSFV